MRAAVVGLGLIGGSAALALEARGYDRDAQARARARERGIDAADSLAQAVQGRDVVLLAVPTGETPALLDEVAAASPHVLITDTASLKLPIAAAAAALPAAVRFVGGHPMAGSRTHGIAGARTDLFHGRPWLVVPTERSDDRSIAAIEALARGIGARPVVLDARRHDALLTWISHLPHAVASALARAVSSGAGAGLDQTAGPGLLDTTRVADSPSPLALELALADPDALAGAIDSVRAELESLASRLRGRSVEELRTYFEDAARIRRALESSPSPPGGGMG